MTPALGPSFGTAPPARARARPVLQVADRQFQLGAVGAQVGQRDLSRLLHHVAQLAGECDARAAGLRVGQRRLDEQDVAAGAGDREPGRHARHRGPLGRLRGVPRVPEVAVQVIGSDGDRQLDLAGRDLRRDRVVSIASILTKLYARHCRRVGKKRLRKLIWIGWYQIFLIAPLISSCSFQRAEVAASVKDKIVGMSKEQVLAGMVAPPQRASVGQTEVWSLFIRWRHEHSQHSERIN